MIYQYILINLSDILFWFIIPWIIIAAMVKHERGHKLSDETREQSVSGMKYNEVEI